MTASTHEYTATLVVGGDEYPLDIRRQGSIVLDESRAPHVAAGLELALPDESTQQLLDPRLGARVRIDVSAEFPTQTQQREFDLALRSRPIRHGRDASASVSLASDESLLDTYRAGQDDATPLELAGSLRDVVDYVLDTVIPGAQLEADPDNDADLTPYWRVVNLHRNPAVAGSTLNFTARSGCSIAYVPQTSTGYVEVTASGTGAGEVWVVNSAKQDINCQPGKTYNYSIRARALSGTRGAQIGLVWIDISNAIIGITWGATTPLSTSYETYTVSGDAPANAAKVGPLFRFGTGTAGQKMALDAVMLFEGDPRFAVDSFTGSDSPDGGYTYEYQGDPDDSPSVRIPDVERDPEALLWRAGMTALEFLHPLVQSAGYRLVCDEQRRWTLRDENYVAPGALTVREGVNMIQGEDVLDIDAGLWFDAQTTIYRWTDRDGIQREAVDYYELNTPPLFVNKVEVDAAYPGPGRSEYAVRRAQGRGREVTVTLVADWRTHAEQTASFTLTDAPIQTGRTSRVEFDLSRDRMTVSSRTTDTSAAAWLLIPEGETWLEQPVGESWTEEVIDA